MIAHGRSTEEIAAELGCDSLHYLSLEGVYEAVRGSRAKHCDACFTGDYPLAGSDGAAGKFSLEEVQEAEHAAASAAGGAEAQAPAGAEADAEPVPLLSSS